MRIPSQIFKFTYNLIDFVYVIARQVRHFGMILCFWTRSEKELSFLYWVHFRCEHKILGNY